MGKVSGEGREYHRTAGADRHIVIYFPMND